MADRFQRSDPGRYRLVSWKGSADDGQPRDDVVALVLGLARNLSAEDMAAQFSALLLAVEKQGDADLDAFMVEMGYTMLTLRDYPELLKREEAKTMAEMVDRFQRSLDELVERGVRQGIKQGIQRGARRGRQQGQTLVLRRLIERKFGEETAGQLARPHLSSDARRTGCIHRGARSRPSPSA